MVTSASPVWAQDSAAAEVLFREAQKDLDAGRVEAGCAKLRESNRLDPAVGTTFNLGDCEERLGRLATAWEHFRHVIDALPNTDPRRPVAERRAAALEPGLPRLTLVGTLPSDAVVKRDDIVVGRASLGLPLPLDPGPHVVVVEAPGHVDRRYEIDAVAATQRTLTLELGDPEPEPASPPVAPHSSLSPASAPTTPPSAPQPPPPASGGDGFTTAAWVAGGIGAAGLVLAAVAGGLTLAAKASVDEHCDAERLCSSQDGVDAAERGAVTGPLTTVGFVVGGVGAAAAVTLALMSDGEDSAASLRLFPGGGSLVLRF
ncbi:MAG: hypothetical protein KC731_15990 [Myxococcales bacterium]|nr:hypothetical protein [Myxococcales bacterium]